MPAPAPIIKKPQNHGQIERRERILRYLESCGGTLEGMKRDELAKAVGISQYTIRDDILRLEEYGVLEIRQVSVIGKGSQPCTYKLLQPAKWFRAHAGELETQRRRRMRSAGIAIRKAEEERVRERDTKRIGRQVQRRNERARTNAGLPAVAPPEGEPEPKTVAVSSKLTRALVDEGLALPSAELAAWGA